MPRALSERSTKAQRYSAWKLRGPKQGKKKAGQQRSGLFGKEERDAKIHAPKTKLKTVLRNRHK